VGATRHHCPQGAEVIATLPPVDAIFVVARIKQN